jgi:hypothetical protein
MTSAGGDPERFRPGYRQAHVVRAEDRHDDGLVHNHGWAMSGTSNTVAMAASGGTFATMAFSGSAKADRFSGHDAVWTEDRHDDGLVHNHEWAVSGK